jgi:hypothetical protein
MPQKAKLYVRVAMTGGRWSYVAPAYTAAHRVRPQFAVVNGKAAHHPESVYYLRYSVDGKRIWERVGEDASLAVVRLNNRNHGFQSEALGLQGTSVTMVLSEPRLPPKPQLRKRSLGDAVIEYLEETESKKAAKTFSAYSITLKLFWIGTRVIALQRDRQNGRHRRERSAGRPGRGFGHRPNPRTHGST